MDSLTPKGYHPVHLTGEGCTGCAICAIICPEAALTIYREAPVKAAKGVTQAPVVKPAG
jgi:2-oxoglutarate ferredoxin oxidoreductase subunit delta